MRALQHNSVQKSSDSVTQQGPVMYPVRIEIEINSQGKEAPIPQQCLIPSQPHYSWAADMDFTSKHNPINSVASPFDKNSFALVNKDVVSPCFVPTIDMNGMICTHIHTMDMKAETEL